MTEYEQPEVTEIGSIEQVTENGGHHNNGPPPFSTCPGEGEGTMHNPNCP